VWRSLADGGKFSLEGLMKYHNLILARNGILRNAALIGNSAHSGLLAYLECVEHHKMTVTVVEQLSKPYAMLECKRVGVEEGMRKGPQTIEKAKQGAYVAKAVSSVHKSRNSQGALLGIVHKADGSIYSRPYAELVDEISRSQDAELLRDFVLTIGIVSNHGNWFTSDNPNKELRVLAQSYDWLVFLTDRGLAEFITELLLDPKPLLRPAKKAFLASYKGDKTKNQFTKVQMSYEADQVLQKYFATNRKKIESWFNVIAPTQRTMKVLQDELRRLRAKNWQEVHAL
jgi:hypothetical protein